MNFLLHIWERLTTSTETYLLRAESNRLSETNTALELELAALRKDNRTLVNAQLRQAGVVTLPELADDKPISIRRTRHLTHQQRQRLYALETAKELDHGNGQSGRSAGPVSE